MNTEQFVTLWITIIGGVIAVVLGYFICERIKKWAMKRKLQTHHCYGCPGFQEETLECRALEEGYLPSQGRYDMMAMMIIKLFCRLGALN